MATVIRPDDEHLEKTITEIESIKGYCLLIDMVGSTIAKDSPRNEWVIKFMNTIMAQIMMLREFWPPLKCMGDECMYFISDPDEALSPLSIFCRLTQIVEDSELRYFLKTKVAICYCTEILPITFIPNTNDIYGKEIDLSARIAHLAGDQEILMNKAFFRRLKADESSQRQNPFLTKTAMIKGPELTELKGFSSKIEVYRWCIDTQQAFSANASRDSDTR